MMQRIRFFTGAPLYFVTSVVTLMSNGHQSSTTRLKIVVICAFVRFGAAATMVLPPFHAGSVTVSPSKSR